MARSVWSGSNLRLTGKALVLLSTGIVGKSMASKKYPLMKKGLLFAA